MKIILADDDEISRRIIASFLSRFGYETHVVNDGAEAWAALQSNMAPSLAIFDWMMPRMSGLEVCSRLRALKRPVRPYVILLSSRNSKLDIVKGLEAGADDYLVKPCDLAELQARLRVAERALKHDAQLRKTISELERLVRRHNLLGEIAGNRQINATAANDSTEPVAGKTELPTLLANAFKEVGLSSATVTAEIESGRAPEFSIWLPLYLTREQTWTDLRLDVQRGAAHEICRAVLQRSARSAIELQDVLVETVHLIPNTGSIGRLKQSSGLISLMAVQLSREKQETLASQSASARYSIQLGESFVTVSEFSRTLAPINRSAKDLQPGDVVLEQVMSPETSQIVLLSTGDILTRRRIDNLLIESPEVPMSVVPIPEPTRGWLSIGDVS